VNEEKYDVAAKVARIKPEDEKQLLNPTAFGDLHYNGSR
jgi:hypothetical protein